MSHADHFPNPTASPRRTLLLVSAYAGSQFGGGPAWLRSRSRSNTTDLTQDPRQAQAIVFAESHPPDPYFSAVLRHPLVRRYPDKVVLYHDSDRSITQMRTLSPSIERWQYDRRHKRSFHYFGRLCENSLVDQCVSFACPRLHLFSFVGSATTHPLRALILGMKAPDCVLHDTGNAHAWLMEQPEREAYEARYLETMLSSYFILCPRGVGPATYRLFEAMQLARVPVIISDGWVPIEGVPWGECSIRVPERDVEQIPALLDARVAEAETMGRRAREVWESFFSPEVTLDRLAEAAVDLVGERYGVRERLTDLSQFRDPWHLRNLARYGWRRIRDRIGAG